MSAELRRVPFDDLEVDDNQATVLDGVPFTGLAEEQFPNGSPRAETSFVEGLRQGTTKLWHANGKLREQAEYWSDARHGTTREWTDDGRLRSERVYEFGIQKARREYDASGAVKEEWKLSPADGLYSTLELSRQRFRGAPPVD